LALPFATFAPHFALSAETDLIDKMKRKDFEARQGIF
jgi:hypothetical protein